jgi:hypothetical protein
MAPTPKRGCAKMASVDPSVAIRKEKRIQCVENNKAMGRRIIEEIGNGSHLNYII